MSPLFDNAPDLYDERAASNLAVMPAPKRSLREHLDGCEAIIETIESLDDESLDEAARLELSEMLISALAGTRQKVDNVSAALGTWIGLEESAAREIERLQLRRQRFIRLRTRLEDYTLALLEASNLPKIEGNLATLALRRNPPSVRIDDEKALPNEFFRQAPPPAPVPDKTRIASALKAKVEVPGARLVQTARLVRS